MWSVNEEKRENLSVYLCASTSKEEIKHSVRVSLSSLHSQSLFIILNVYHCELKNCNSKWRPTICQSLLSSHRWYVSFSIVKSMWSFIWVSLSIRRELLINLKFFQSDDDDDHMYVSEEWREEHEGKVTLTQ
jgi:hypothetical protein